MADSDRRAILRGLPALGLAAGLAACGGKASSGEERAHLGPARTVAFAVGTTGSDFVTEISVGAADAAEMLGWRFTRVLNPQPTPEFHINAIKNAIAARADVVVTVDWYQAVVDEIRRTQGRNVRFAIVNSASSPAALAAMNVPFVGQEPHVTGKLMGERIASTLRERGVTQGSVLVGNPFPGSVNVEARIRGIGDGLAAGGAYRMVSFADGSAAEPAASVSLYKAKITELGDVVAHAVAGGEMSVVPLAKALSELGPQARGALVASWGSSLRTFKLVKDGQVTFALDENLYYQGFMAVLLAWSQFERGLPAVTLSSGHVWVAPDNVDAMIASYERRKAAAVAYGLS